MWCLHLLSINFTFRMEHQVYIACYLRLELVWFGFITSHCFLLSSNVNIYKFEYMCGGPSEHSGSIAAGDANKLKLKTLSLSSCGCSPVSSWRASTWSRSPSSHCFFSSSHRSTKSTMTFSIVSLWHTSHNGGVIGELLEGATVHPSPMWKDILTTIHINLMIDSPDLGVLSQVSRM